MALYGRLALPCGLPLMLRSHKRSPIQSLPEYVLVSLRRVKVSFAATRRRCLMLGRVLFQRGSGESILAPRAKQLIIAGCKRSAFDGIRLPRRNYRCCVRGLSK